MIRKVISGGQTGADQGGLIAAKQLGLATGGWLPHGCDTEAGPREDLLEEYDLERHPADGYVPRTYANVRDSDGTIRIAYDFNSAGERCTQRAITKYDKPSIDVNVSEVRPFTDVVDWVLENNIEVLNVAGNRESTWPGMQAFVVEYLTKVLNECKEQVN